MKRLPFVLYALVAIASLAFAGLQPPHEASVETSSVALAANAAGVLGVATR